MFNCFGDPAIYGDTDTYSGPDASSDSYVRDALRDFGILGEVADTGNFFDCDFNGYMQLSRHPTISGIMKNTTIIISEASAIVNDS
jgi:hypothetical protein